MIEHPNTNWLARWEKRMREQYGHPASGCWCRELAVFAEELGNDHPSDEALAVAREWERCAPVFAEASND